MPDAPQGAEKVCPRCHHEHPLGAECDWQAPQGGGAEQAFTEYVVRNLPPDTVIGDPEWWAPRLFRAALHALASQADAGLAPLVPSPAEDGDREVVERILATCDDIADTMLRCTAKIHPDQTKPTDWEPYPTHVRLMGDSWTPVKHADLLRARDAEIETILSRLAALRARADSNTRRADTAVAYVLASATRLAISRASVSGENIGERVLCAIDSLTAARDALAQRVGEVMPRLKVLVRALERHGEAAFSAEAHAIWCELHDAALAGRKGEGNG